MKKRGGWAGRAFGVFGLLEQTFTNFHPPEGKVCLKTPKSPNPPANQKRVAPPLVVWVLVMLSLVFWFRWCATGASTHREAPHPCPPTPCHHREAEAHLASQRPCPTPPLLRDACRHPYG